MSTDIRRHSAEREAEAVVASHGITSPPVCPFGIAERNGILVEPKPGTNAGVSGFLLWVGDSLGIMYATNIDSAGFIRFTVAHELGHYFMPGHFDAIFRNENCHVSKCGFESNEGHEREADFFATALLMPRAFFESAMNQFGPGIGAIKGLAETFETSLTATAIRYAQLTPDPVITLVSRGRAVEYSFLSRTLKELRGCQWPRRGSRLSPATATADFNKNTLGVESCTEVSGFGTLDQWLPGAPPVNVREEVLGLGKYGKTLTVVFSETPFDDDDSEDYMEDEEEDLRLPSERGYFPKKTRRR